jgi:molecular chaperone DnaJ
MAKRDYYAVLGVTRGIRGRHQEAYRRLAMSITGPQPGQRLRDKFRKRRGVRSADRRQKRAAYDHFGHAGVDHRGFGAAGARGGPEGFGGFADAFGDIFGEIFGAQRGGRGTGAYRGADLRYNHEIALEDAARGTEAKIRIPTLHACETCHGTGAKPGTQPKQCGTCHGRGEVRVSQGFFSINRLAQPVRFTQVIPDPCDVSRRRREKQR